MKHGDTCKTKSWEGKVERSQQKNVEPGWTELREMKERLGECSWVESSGTVVYINDDLPGNGLGRVSSRGFDSNEFVRRN